MSAGWLREESDRRAQVDEEMTGNGQTNRERESLGKVSRVEGSGGTVLQGRAGTRTARRKPLGTLESQQLEQVP